MIRWLLLLAGAAAGLTGEPAPVTHRGLYAIGLPPGQKADHRFIKGGQVLSQWREVEPLEGKYDFSSIDGQLEVFEKAGRAATVQIDGNEHPEWLFSRVPYHEKKFSVQVRDVRGTLAYWHPVYAQAYRRLVQAYGTHLRSSPLRDAALGIRLNFNAVGTEHADVPEAERDPGSWIVPQSTPAAAVWTPAAAREYRSDVVDNFVEAFLPDVRVFLLNNLPHGPEPLAEAARKLIEGGGLGLFHTSSEMEPRAGNAAQYQAFLRYCRTGQTACYAEPPADAWGRHAGQTDARWCSAEAFNYWRLLADLHYGVSYMAVSGADLEHADEPEFRAGFEFAARYAGYHASPSVAPGAWVALREGNTLPGDYTFLMRRSGKMAPVEKAGPPGQRFGAWARTLAPGAHVEFELDPVFARSLRGESTLAVTYLDTGQGSLTLRCGGTVREVVLVGTGRWQTATFAADAWGGRISLAADTAVTLHMLEVWR